MNDVRPIESSEHRLKPYLSPLGALALSIGCSVGWGSFIITCNTYLLQAGPLGSIGGLLVGAALMIAVAKNYCRLMQEQPDAGGSYAYAKNVFGIDFGFLIAWFLLLVYMAIFWANATSLPLFARYFIGDYFCFGYLYTVFGYDVYLEEALLVVAAIISMCVACSKARKGMGTAIIAMAAVFAVAIVACFVGAVGSSEGLYRVANPLYLPNQSLVSQIFQIACVSPWAFIGFESISNSSEEFTFPQRRTFRVFVGSIAVVTLLYVLVVLLSSSAYPLQYSNWFYYLSDLDNLSGVEALPAFYAAQHYLGDAGVYLLMAALLALVLSSLVGLPMAVSRLVYALAKDAVMPKRFAELNDRGNPQNALLLVAVVSLFIPFLGRTAIGWIVDVTTLGAVVIYGIISAAAFKTSRVAGDTRGKVAGAVGVVVMAMFGFMILFPEISGSNSMASESYFLFAIWSLAGFVVFRVLLQTDPEHRFGQSIIVWFSLIFLLFFTSLAWMGQANQESIDGTIAQIQGYYGSADRDVDEIGEIRFIEKSLVELGQQKTINSFVVMGLLGISFGIMLSNFAYFNRRDQEHEEELGEARNVANTDALTGVKSKHAFAEWELRLDASIEGGEAPDFAVVVCDLNGLKYVNDTQGHRAGDAYIREACMLICRVFAHSPVFRIGGDEFAALLQGSDFENRDKLMAEFNDIVLANLKAGNVVVSAGISDYRRGEDATMRVVFERADERMYVRKKELKAAGAVTR